MSQNLTSVQIAWVAGLIEGEGTFGVTQTNSPFIAIQMNDKDVLEQAQSIMNGTSLYGPYKHRRGDSYDTPHYRLAVYGTLAISWMMTLYTLMQSRRKAKMKYIIDWWIQKPKVKKGRRAKIERCYTESLVLR